MPKSKRDQAGALSEKPNRTQNSNTEGQSPQYQLEAQGTHRSEIAVTLNKGIDFQMIGKDFCALPFSPTKELIAVMSNCLAQISPANDDEVTLVIGRVFSECRVVQKHRSRVEAENHAAKLHEKLSDRAKTRDSMAVSPEEQLRSAAGNQAQLRELKRIAEEERKGAKLTGGSPVRGTIDVPGHQPVSTIIGDGNPAVLDQIVRKVKHTLSPTKEEVVLTVEEVICGKSYWATSSRHPVRQMYVHRFEHGLKVGDRIRATVEAQRQREISYTQRVLGFQYLDTDGGQD